jgi:hypothetical protein
MNTSAIILMSLVWIPVISLTIYFFVRILQDPKKTKNIENQEEAQK